MPHLKNKLSGDYNKTRIKRNFVSKVEKNMRSYTSLFSLLLILTIGNDWDVGKFLQLHQK